MGKGERELQTDKPTDTETDRETDRQDRMNRTGQMEYVYIEYNRIE